MMTKLKVPSVQHLARHWHESPGEIEEKLVNLAMNPPIFNYNLLNEIARDCMLLKVPKEHISDGIRDKEKRVHVQKIFLEILPLLHSHFSAIQQDFLLEVAPSYYPIGRDLSIPFKPLFTYGLGGRFYLPWPIFWKRNPLSEMQLSLFVTLSKELLRQDPDLDEARFEILDFSAPYSEECRKLRVIDSADVPLLNRKKTSEMLSVFVEGFERAQKRLKNMNSPIKRKESEVIVDINQFQLWND